MTSYKNRFITISCLFLTNAAFASNNPSIDFFASNNSKEINIQTAYDRLTGTAQSDLQNSMIKILQKNHIDQGQFENILGTYRMSSDKNMTADNTEHFKTSPYQHLSDEAIFSLAKELAIKLNQDSVAVLIPDYSKISDIIVSFSSRSPSINEVINTVHDKLPALYSQAFSFHLTNTCHGFDKAKVAGIEWLGSKINMDEVKKAFPEEQVNFNYGKVFLVYKDGKKQQL